MNNSIIEKMVICDHCKKPVRYIDIAPHTTCFQCMKKNYWNKNKSKLDISDVTRQKTKK